MNTKNIALNVNYVSRIQVIKWTEEFKERYYTRTKDKFLILIIKGVTFDEFIKLVADYEMSAENKADVHIVANHQFPHEDVLITCKS